MSQCRVLFVATLALCGTAIAPAVASDRIDQAFNAPEAIFGEMSLWVQGIIPTNTVEDGETCPEDDDEFCGTVFGAGGYLGVGLMLSDDFAVIGDIVVDAHPETDGDPAGRDDPAFYRSLGLHGVYDAGQAQFGVFGVAIGGTANERSETIGPVYGAGVQARRDNLFAQAGVLHAFGDDVDDRDTIGTLYFGRFGGEMDLGPGLIEASVALGAGDFDDDDGADEDNRGYWAQFAAEYEAPLFEEAGINWFVGYQGDWVQVDDDDNPPDRNRTLLNTVRAGITIPLGSRDLPFKTPNFRAPVTSAAEMN